MTPKVSGNSFVWRPRPNAFESGISRTPTWRAKDCVTIV